MGQIIEAIYEDGVLRPLTPLNLKQKQVIHLQIVKDSINDEIDATIQSLVAEGVLTPPPGCDEEDPASESERLRLAAVLGKSVSKPLSEIIIEDRGES